jgi:hypothetical protein
MFRGGENFAKSTAMNTEGKPVNLIRDSHVIW